MIWFDSSIMFKAKSVKLRQPVIVKVKLTERMIGAKLPVFLRVGSDVPRW